MYCLVTQACGEVGKQSKMHDSIKLGQGRWRNASREGNTGIKILGSVLFLQPGWKYTYLIILYNLNVYVYYYVYMKNIMMGSHPMYF